MHLSVPRNITSVIFDLGGVLFEIDYALTQQAFRALGAKDFALQYSQQKQAGLFDEFEKGNISPHVFRQQVRQWLPQQISDAAIDSAWNKMLFGITQTTEDLLKLLGKRYRLFLLSNTNEIHLSAVLAITTKHNNGKGLASLFEHCYYSCRIGMRKPDNEIFDKVCRDNKLHVPNTLFIDDSAQNIEGAKQYGLVTLQYIPSLNLQGYFG